MKNSIDIEVVLDEKFVDPSVTIRAKDRSDQVENIITAIENASEDAFPGVSVKSEGAVSVIPQRNIIRARTEGRKIVVDTDEGTFAVKYSISALEDMLDSTRFFRISQSEIINLYRVKNFDVSIAGTILVEFENGESTYVARRYIKALKQRLG